MTRVLAEMGSAPRSAPAAADRSRTCHCSKCLRRRANVALEQEEQFLGLGRTLFDQITGCRIEDRTALTPKSKRIRERDPSTVYALVLHQMAFSRGSDPTRYDNVTAHYAILPDGKILQLHPASAYLYASNGFNTGSVAVEFAGNLPSTRGRCWKPEKYGCHQLTEAQIRSGRCLVRHLIRTIGLTHILAHRQASGTRGNCPGPDIWYQVGQWAVDNLGLKDGGPGFKIGTGTPIPDEWRNWGRSGTSRELNEPQSDIALLSDEKTDFNDWPASDEWKDAALNQDFSPGRRFGSNSHQRRQLEFEAMFDEDLLDNEITAATEVPTPGRYYQIKRGDNGLLTVAGQVKAGGTREQRAKIINNHPRNRKYWRSPQNAYEERVFPHGIISFAPRFNCGASSAKENCYARIFIPAIGIVVDEPTVVTGDKPISSEDKIRQDFRERARKAIAVLDRRSPTEPIKRTICILKKLLRSSTDSRYVTIHLAKAYAELGIHGAPTPSSYTENLYTQALDRARLSKSLNGFIDGMIALDEEIFQGIQEVKRQLRKYFAMRGLEPKNATARRMRDWVADQQRKQGSIYSCYV